MLRFLLYLGKANGAISRHVVPGGFRSPLFFCLSLFSLLSRRGGTKKNTRREPVRPRTWVLLCFRERRCVGLLKKKVDIWVKVLRKCSAFTSLPAGGRNETVGCFFFVLFFSLKETPEFVAIHVRFRGPRACIWVDTGDLHLWEFLFVRYRNCSRGCARLRCHLSLFLFLRSK